MTEKERETLLDNYDKKIIKQEKEISKLKAELEREQYQVGLQMGLCDKATTESFQKTMEVVKLKEELSEVKKDFKYGKEMFDFFDKEWNDMFSEIVNKTEEINKIITKYNEVIKELADYKKALELVIEDNQCIIYKNKNGLCGNCRKPDKYSCNEYQKKYYLKQARGHKGDKCD